MSEIGVETHINKKDARSLPGMSSRACPMLIPHQELEPSILRKVVEEFVTRDGTDSSSVETRIETVLKQLKNGQAELHFDNNTKTSNILSSDWASE